MRHGLLRCVAAVVLLIVGQVRAESAIEQISPDALKAILQEERGNVVVLNLWATWCAPCLTEIPDLQKLEADMADQNVSLIGIAVDEPRGNTRHIETMRDQRFPGFRTYARDNRDTDYLVSVVDPAWNEVVPTTYIIGRDGSVQTRIQGKKSLDAFKVAVTEVMNEPALPNP